MKLVARRTVTVAEASSATRTHARGDSPGVRRPVRTRSAATIGRSSCACRYARGEAARSRWASVPSSVYARKASPGTPVSPGRLTAPCPSIWSNTSTPSAVPGGKPTRTSTVWSVAVISTWMPPSSVTR